MWVIRYEQDERKYCVGYYIPVGMNAGSWVSFHEFDLIEEAARHVHWLNGGHEEDRHDR